MSLHRSIDSTLHRRTAVTSSSCILDHKSQDVVRDGPLEAFRKLVRAINHLAVSLVVLMDKKEKKIMLKKKESREELEGSA